MQKLQSDYDIAYMKAEERLLSYQQTNEFENKAEYGNRIYRNYRKEGLDPDGKVIRYECGVKCTIDLYYENNRFAYSY